MTEKSGRLTLKEAIEVLKERSAWIKEHFEESTHAEAIDTVVEYCEQKTYTPAEMESFYTWANNNGWYYGELTELWHNDEEDLEGLIIDDVLKIWEATK